MMDQVLALTFWLVLASLGTALVMGVMVIGDLVYFWHFTLVNSLGGLIDIYNEEVGGATVRITIPRSRLTS